MSLLRLRAALVLVMVAFLSRTTVTAEEPQTALDRYIAKADSSYQWKLVSTQPADDYTTYFIELTSQTWRSAAEVDHPVWKHWLTLVKPKTARPEIGFLFIGGGSHREAPPENASARVVQLARDTKTVVAELSNVPNQPLRFSDSMDRERVEDDIIAYTRIKYMATHDPDWLVRLAMVKSGVRALDCMQEFLASEPGGELKVEKFVVAGGSKRGWTTWLVGVVDPRVVAIVPLVIDALNSEQITRHHFEAYGFFSSALNDYVEHGLFPHKIGTPEYREILAIEDPYHYRQRERLRSIPKYLINALGDEFFLPDNSQFYFSELQGEKYLRYVPNAKHNLEGSDALQSLDAFYQSVINGTRRPRFSWKKLSDGSIEVQCGETGQDKPKEVKLWQASNPKDRDFRLDVIGKTWTSTPLEPTTQGTYVGRVMEPKSGYTAMVVELTFESGFTYPFKFTTEVSILPNKLPFRWEQALEKDRQLLK